jgi:hypothetical protein
MRCLSPRGASDYDRHNGSPGLNAAALLGEVTRMGEFTFKAPVGLLSDGSPAANDPRDVKVVQFRFNEIPASAGAPAEILAVNGVLTQETIDGSRRSSSNSLASSTFWSSPVATPSSS